MSFYGPRLVSSFLGWASGRLRLPSVKAAARPLSDLCHRFCQLQPDTVGGGDVEWEIFLLFLEMGGQVRDGGMGFVDDRRDDKWIPSG